MKLDYFNNGKIDSDGTRLRWLLARSILFIMVVLLFVLFQDAAQAQSFGSTKKYNPGFYASTNGWTNNFSFSFLSDKPSIQGIRQQYRWRDLETAEGVYDFSQIYSDLNDLAALGNRRMILDLQLGSWNAAGTPNVPNYITSDPAFGDAGASDGYYGVFDRTAGMGGWQPLWSSQPVTDRIDAMYSALAAEFDSNPLLEMVVGVMGETSAGQPPGQWAMGSNQRRRIWENGVLNAANAFEQTRVSTTISWGSYSMSRLANLAAENDIAISVEDVYLDYDDKGESLWDMPEGIYGISPTLVGRTPTLLHFSSGSVQRTWLYDGVNRREVTAQDLFDFSQSQGIFDTHPDPNVQGRGTYASYVTMPAYLGPPNFNFPQTFEPFTQVVDSFLAGGGTFRRVPDIIQSAGLLNSGFESPGGGTQILGWSGVDDWQSDSPANNSGIDLGVEGADGEWSAFLDSDDPAIWNTTDQAIVAGSSYQATLALRRRINHRSTLAEVTLYYDDNGVRTEIVTEIFDLNPSANYDANLFWFWSDRSLGFDADDYPDAIGKNLGIEIANIGSSSGLLGLDEIRLERILPGIELEGDFDGDLDIDGADFLKWQRGESPNGPGATDLALWQNNFSTPAGLAAGNSTVPEPSLAVLIGMMIGSFAGCRTRFS